MLVEYMTPAIEDRAVEVLTLLADRGQHRAPSIPDLIIAATAELAGLAGEAGCCRDVSARLGYLRAGRYGRLVGEFSGDFAAHGDTGRARVAVRLPPRRPSFVGRTADLGEIAAGLARYPVVTLTGVGGVGKTALAVEAAWM